MLPWKSQQKIWLWVPFNNLFVFLSQVACLRENCAQGISSALTVRTTHRDKCTQSKCNLNIQLSRHTAFFFLITLIHSLTHRLCIKIYKTQFKVFFFLPQSHVSIALRHLPLSFPGLYLSPSPAQPSPWQHWHHREVDSPTVVVLIQWWVIDTQLRTSFVEIALTHTHGDWTELKMDQQTRSSGADTELDLCASVYVMTEHGRGGVFCITSTQTVVVCKVSLTFSQSETV